MEKLKKAIKCAECNETFESPVLLPCSHSMCNKHVKDCSNESIKCGICGVDHQIPPKIGFPKNQALEEIIGAKIGSLDFGKNYTQAKEQCDQLESLLNSIDRLESDPTSYAREEIQELRNRVNSKSEQLKLAIEKKTQELLGLLKDTEKNCASIKKEKYKRNNYFDDIRKKTRSDLELWRNELNEMKFDLSRWSDIAKETKKTMREMEIEMNSYKSYLLGDDHVNNSKVRLFENISLEGNNRFGYIL